MVPEPCYYSHPIPDGFVRVSEEALTEFLKTCPDYVRTDRGADIYSYRHNGFKFAALARDGQCWASPDVLGNEAAPAKAGP